MTPDGGSVADADRLPWLEPYREPRPAKREPKRASTKARSKGGSIFAGLAVAAMIAAGGTGYWLGQRSEAPVSEAPAASVSLPAATVPLPQARSITPVRPPEAEPNAAPPAEPLQRASAEPSRPAAKSAKRTYRKKPARRSSRRRIRSAGLETDQLNSVREAQERASAISQPAPRPAYRPTAYRWPKLPSPGPAGRVIQLGAFSHPDRAYAAYHARIERYPSLGRMPRVIVPVATGRKGRLLYVLRLGTGSRTQSKRVCRNLRRSGDHCIVIG